jgi:chloramphenicol O-acetyltransferase type A
MKQKLDIDNWARKEHFEFFNQFEEPLYGVCINIDCTIAYRVAKEKNTSFFVYCLYRCLEAAQLVEPFKMRIEGKDIFVYDTINAGCTVARPNGTFGFGYIDYHPELGFFTGNAQAEIERVKIRTDLQRSPRTDQIRFSALRWIDFTSVSHARMFSVQDSCPRISFGKMTLKDEVRSMPLSLHVHHALVDGLHIGQYLDCLQGLMNKEN